MPVSTTSSCAPVLISIESLSVEACTQTGLPQPVLKGISLQVHQGELLALAGGSGSGKTTLLLAMMGYLRATMAIAEGCVVFGHHVFDRNQCESEKLWGGEIALVPQNAGASLTPTKKIGEQIDESLRLHTNLSFHQRRQRIIELLQQVNIPAPEQYCRCYPHELSGGQQQRVTIAMALASEPSVLLLDEPTSGLDQKNIHELMALLEGVRLATDLTIIMVSHDLDTIRTLADRVIVMHDGCIVDQGEAAVLLSDKAHRQKVHPQCIKLINAFRPELSRGQVFCGNDGRGESGGRSLLVECRQLNVHHKPAGISGLFKAGIAVLDDVDVGLHRGETVVITGASGSGKSTLLRCIAGIERLQAGMIQFSGTTLRGFKHRSLNDKRKIQLIFQNSDLSLNPAFEIAEIIRAPLALYFNLSYEEQDCEIDRLLQRVQLPLSYRQRYPSQLSGGERQRVSIARACAARPELLLCDEVTSALDVVNRNEILGLLKQLTLEEECGCLVVTHELEVIRQMADRIYVLDSGQVQGCYSYAEYQSYVEQSKSSANFITVEKETGSSDRVRGAQAYA